MYSRAEYITPLYNVTYMYIVTAILITYEHGLVDTAVNLSIIEHFSGAVLITCPGKYQYYIIFYLFYRLIDVLRKAPHVRLTNTESHQPIKWVTPLSLKSDQNTSVYEYGI